MTKRSPSKRRGQKLQTHSTMAIGQTGRSEALRGATEAGRPQKTELAIASIIRARSSSVSGLVCGLMIARPIIASSSAPTTTSNVIIGSPPLVQASDQSQSFTSRTYQHLPPVLSVAV